MSVLNQMFGVASSAAWFRNGGSGTLTRQILASLAKGFGGSTGDGAYVHDLFASYTGQFVQSGFRNTDPFYTQIQQNVPLLGGSFQLGAAAIIYAYANFPNIPEDFVVNYINGFCSALTGFIGGLPATFTTSGLEYTMSRFSLASVNSPLAAISGQNINTGINYNWYDASPLFVNPDLNSMAQLIKDTECQYYYLSGELLYDGLPTGLKPCISYLATVQTPTGQIQIPVYQSTPCVDNNSYVGPISGIKFFREFVDGPGTSGFFDDATIAEYVAFDKSILNPMDYSSNYDAIYTYKINADGSYVGAASGVYIDLPGFYQSGREYGYGHTNYISSGCDPSTCSPSGTWHLLRMHQGDGEPKYFFQSFLVNNGDNTFSCVCNSGVFDWTGWKLAPFELKKSLAKNYSSLKANPKLDTGRVLKRVLNLNNTTDQNGNPITPFLNAYDTGDGVLTCGDVLGHGSFYVGPPQLNGTSALPGFAICQTFDNSNFPDGGDRASVVLRPMITQDDSSFTVSNYNAFSGLDPINHNALNPNQAKIPIFQKISSTGMSQVDDVFRKCFAIGDNFGNQASGTQSVQGNAGYLYTGYAYMQNGVPVTAAELLASSVVKVGDKYSKIKYPIGYQSGAHAYFVSDQNGFIVTGDASTGVFQVGQPITYSYFTDGVLGASNSGWAQGTFAPVPQAVIDNYWQGITPIYSTQAVENYLPRYINGPYLTYDSNFLYPNAQKVSTIYNSNVKGFPTGIKYVISVKEETVREVFMVSGFGGVTKNRYPVRAGSGNVPITLETLMVRPFTPNDSLYTFKYDFLNNEELYPDVGSFFYQASLTNDPNLNLVNQDYVPSTTGCLQTNLNHVIYQNYSSVNFMGGIKITGQMNTRTIATGKNASGTFSYPVSLADGLYWGYNGAKISGTMLYCPPLFDLSTYSLNPSDNLRAAMLTNINGPVSPVYSNNGDIANGSLYDQNFQYAGRDTLFYHYVGGRSGQGAEAEGGYNPEGNIGDAWYDVEMQQFGKGRAQCGFGTYDFRYPLADDYVSLASMTSTGLNLFMRGMKYYPYYLDWSYNPFTTPAAPNIGVNTTSVEVNFTDYYFNFDLLQQFPLQSGLTGSGVSGLYSSGGLTLGPFDRDIELCVLSGNQIIPSGFLIVDGVQLTSNNSPWNCPDPVTSFTIDSGIIPYQNGRGGRVTTFKLVPSGKTTNINLSGDGLLGFTGNSIVTVRPRNSLGAVVPYGVTEPFDSTTLSGDTSYMNSLIFINNGSEVRFSFPNTSTFDGLVGQTFSATTDVREEFLFPVPDSSDFDAILKPSIDALGNKTYKQKHPTLSYWQAKTPSAYFTGIREVTRVHLSIDSIEVELGPLPYQTFKTLIPSGNCTISGVFGYTGEAESAIVSDGIILSGQSGAKALSGIFQPIYVSDVLQRLPTGFFVLPSGSGYMPILPAPSYMKRRRNVHQITGNDAWVSAAPSGVHYNEFLWPAWSDLALLNPEVVYEQMPPDDGNVFLDSYLTFSASQGQNVGTGKNPSENVTYKVLAQYGFIDSVATNPLYNTGKCIFSGAATKTTLNSGDLSGILTSQGNSLTMALNLRNFRR